MMAQNIKIAGATYSNVPSISIPKADNSGNAIFPDTSDATAAAANIERGYTAYVNGVKVTGTNDGGGGGTDHDFLVTVDFNPVTMMVSNSSATLAEIVGASKAGKDVRLNAVFSDGSTIYEVFCAQLVEAYEAYSPYATKYEVKFGAVCSMDENRDMSVTVTGDGLGSSARSLVLTYEIVPKAMSVYLGFTYDLVNGPEIVSANTSGPGLGHAISLMNSDYLERLHVFIPDILSQTNALIPLSAVYLDAGNQYMSFRGVRDGICYTLHVEIFNENPGFGYVEHIYDDEGAGYFLALTLDLSLDGSHEEFYIAVDSSVPGSYGDILVETAALPYNFELLFMVMIDTLQIEKITLHIEDSGVFGGIMLSAPGSAISGETVLFGNAILRITTVENVSVMFYVTDIYPTDVFFLDLSDGSYLVILAFIKEVT